MNALTINNLSKTYPNGTQALNAVSLNIESGDFFALLGPNGAGKSTLIGILTSLVIKSAGSVQIYDYDIDQDFITAKQSIGVVPQEFNFNVFESPFNILVNQAGYYGIPRKIAKQRAEKYLKQLFLWEKRHVTSRSLSGGMKRRLMIARAMMHEPKLLILDEPTAGVDIDVRRTMWDFLTRMNEAGTTIVLTTHYLEEAENLCRNIAIINQGKLVESTSMASLLRKLDSESYIFYANDTIAHAPSIEHCDIKLLDTCTFEITAPGTVSLTTIMQALDAQGINVKSMRNKTNRLEELFIQLTKKREEHV